MLTNYDGNSISYDANGNPYSYPKNGKTYMMYWTQGRRLQAMSSGTSDNLSFTYNADGIRTSKTVNGVKHIYALSGSTVLSEEWTENGVQHLIIYAYDTAGSPIGMLYRNSTYLESFFDSYLFGKNIQGDILYIYDKNGNRLVSYTYDAWGNILSTVYSNGGASTSARFNPLRYRGYYYDTETGLYYLNSRYYDSVAGRFINADEIINGNGDILGYNLFAYCSNNPVMFDDFSGQGFTTWLKNRWDDVKQVAKKTYDFITNDNENVVLNAKHIAFYKGKLVVKLPIGGNAASFGIIFLGDDVAQRGDAVETVKHEYGHTKQFFSMGILGYAVCVAVPSISCNLLDRMNLLQYDYYSSPWEYDADMYGGVNRGNYESWADVVNKIYKSFVNIVMFAES